MSTNPVAPVPSLEEAEPNHSYLRDELREKIEESSTVHARYLDSLTDYLWPWFEAELRAEHRLTLDSARAECAALHTREPAPLLAEVARRLFAWAEEGRIPPAEAHWMIAACEEPAPLDRERALEERVRDLAAQFRREATSEAFRTRGDLGVARINARTYSAIATELERALTGEVAAPVHAPADCPECGGVLVELWGGDGDTSKPSIGLTCMECDYQFVWPEVAAPEGMGEPARYRRCPKCRARWFGIARCYNGCAVAPVSDETCPAAATPEGEERTR